LVMNAQDIHFSQFFNSPLNLNPALTGKFNGNTRVHANYRNQWKSVPVDFLSADVGIDFNFAKAGKKNALGLGALINYDKAGDLSLNMTGINGFVSYAIAVSDNKSITPGINVSYAQRKYEIGAVRSGNQWNGFAYDPSIPSELVGVDQTSYFDLGVGLNYRGQKNIRKFLDVGVGLYHLIQPTDSFDDVVTTGVNRPMRMTLYAMLNQQVSKSLDLLVNVMHQRQEPYRETVLNAQGKIYMGKNLDKALYLGLGYRLADAWYPMIGIEVGRLYGAFSYDFNISDFDVATSGTGGPELSLRYIFSRIPEGVYKPCLIY
jgi:type IX secretion system PorP/SprF family membrane protein